MLKKLLSAALAALLMTAMAAPALAAAVTKITVSNNLMDMTVGESRTLTYTLYPYDGEDTVRWSAGNTKVASVDQNGTITAHEVGSTTITATTGNGKVARCTVNVYREGYKKETKEVDLYPSTVTVRVDQTRQLWSSILPVNNDDEVMEWVSSDTNIADVNPEGVVTGIAPGTATITATTYNGVTGTCTVKVTDTYISGSTTSPAATPASSGELLTSAEVKTAVEEAARKTLRGDLGTATFKDKTSLSATVAGAAAYTAETKNRAIQLKFTTTGIDSKTQGFLILDPAKAKERESDISLQVSLDSTKATSAKSKFEKYYTNSVAVIDCAHAGDFGQQVTVGAKVDLSGMSGDNLHFYLYDSAANRVDPLSVASYRVDDNGFLRISTSVGGVIVVSDGALNKK